MEVHGLSQTLIGFHSTPMGFNEGTDCHGNAVTLPLKGPMALPWPSYGIP